MNVLCIGIDPSLNSTGVCVLLYKDNKLIRDNFYIIKPNKLTKKENVAEYKYITRLQYIIYDKKTDNTGNYSLNEITKTQNYISIVNAINDIINSEVGKLDNNVRLIICQEGISYGSVNRTNIIFDLSGLNYMIRMKLIKKQPDLYIIASPSEIKKFATSKGNANKNLMLEFFKIYYPDFTIPKIDDIVDAFFMAKYGYEKDML